MAIENSVSYDSLYTFVDSIDVFDCRLPGVMLVAFANKCFHSKIDFRLPKTFAFAKQTNFNMCVYKCFYTRFFL